MVSADSKRMAASPRQRRAAAEILRAGGTQTEAAAAAGMNVSTIKRWLDQPAFQAIVRGSPDIRVGAPPTVGRPGNAGAFEQDERLRMWVASGAARKGPEVLGRRIAPDAYDDPTAVVHVHVVPPDAVAAVVASIAAGAYPAESHYVPVLLAGLDELLDNLPLLCLLGSSDQLRA